MILWFCDITLQVSDLSGEQRPDMIQLPLVLSHWSANQMGHIREGWSLFWHQRHVPYGSVQQQSSLLGASEYHKNVHRVLFLGWWHIPTWLPSTFSSFVGITTSKSTTSKCNLLAPTAPVLLWNKYPLIRYSKGCVCTMDWDIPGLKSSQASSRGTAKHPAFSENMELVPKKLKHPALLCGFWEGSEPMTEFRKLPGASWFQSHSIPILDFNLKSHFHCDYLLDIFIIYLTSWGSDFKLYCQRTMGGNNQITFCTSSTI